MKEYTYNFGDESFDQWASQHQDCELLFLEGKMACDEDGMLAKSIDEALLSLPSLAQVDVGGLTIAHFLDEDVDKDCVFFVNPIDIFPVDDWVGIVGRMKANPECGSRFAISQNEVRSLDGDTLIWIRPDEKIDIPHGIKNIGRCACMYFENLSHVCLPESLERIGDEAFYMAGLETVEFPCGLKELGVWAFAYCDIDYLEFSCQLKVIPEGCFWGNYSYEIKSFPEGLEVIEDCAFSLGTYATVHVPEGVRRIGSCAFPEIKEVWLPSTLVELDKRFADDDCPGRYEPKVVVGSGNPIFYDVKGTLFERGKKEPYLGFNYKEPVPPEIVHQPQEEGREYSIEELRSHYAENNFRPINSEMTRFWVYDPKLGYNIIDRRFHYYLDGLLVANVRYFMDGPVMITEKDYGHHHIYANDLSQELVSDKEASYSIYDFDEEGRVYVEEDDSEGILAKDWSPFSDAHMKRWCIRYDGTPILGRKYEDLGVFTQEGLATAKQNKRWGMINMREEAVIPFEYRELEDFDCCGMAVAKKGKYKGYINRKNEVVVPFEYDMFYRRFEDGDLAIALRGDPCKAFLLDRDNHVLGEEVKDDSQRGIWNQGFHLFRKGDLWGYSHQFGNEFSGCRFRMIERVKPGHIRVSEDGDTFEDLYIENCYL